MNKGKVSVEIKGNMIKDPESQWESTPFYRFLRGWYNKYIIPARIESMQGKVAGDVRDFKEQLKSYLELSGKR